MVLFYITKDSIFYCVALGYLWSNWFKEAFEAEQYFLTNELWDELEAGIHAYLSVLIIKKQF